MSRIGGANPLPKQRLQAIFSPRIAMRVSRDWDYAVVAGVCPDDEKTGGRVCGFAERQSRQIRDS